MVYLGIFSPIPMTRISPTRSGDKLCFIMLRKPLDRLISHYSRFGVAAHYDNIDLEMLPLDKMEEAIRRTGGAQFQTRFLGCDGEESCPVDDPSISKKAFAELRRCHVGVTDQFKTVLGYLKILLPWLDLDSIAELHAQKANYITGKMFVARLGNQHEKKRAVKQWFQADSLLYDYGYNLFVNQTKRAIVCYKNNAPQVDTDAFKLMRLISRKVRRGDVASMWNIAQCVERSVYCRDGPLQEKCNCTEAEIRGGF
jgi:hypothetical protein